MHQKTNKSFLTQQKEKNGQKWSKMVKNGRKWSIMVKNGQRYSKRSKMVKNGQNLVKNNQKWSKTALDGPLLAKFLKSDVKIDQFFGKNGPRQTPF